MKNQNLSYDEYLNLIKKKRKAGTYDFSQQVFYKGKVLQKCPPNTHKMGATCIPGVPDITKRTAKSQDLGGVSATQAKNIAKAKSTKEVMKAKQNTNKRPNA